MISTGIRHRVPVLIVIGLLTLLLAAWWPAVPVVTGMALVALGATSMTMARFKCSAAFPAVVAGYAFVYLNLYLLFIAAICHSAIYGPHGGLSFLQGLDLVASVVPMAVLARLSVLAIMREGNAPAR